MNILKTYENWKEELISTKEISESYFLQKISKLKHFNVSDSGLYRGVDIGVDIAIIDPKKYIRKTIFGSTETMILTYNELWKNYPKRLNSLITTNSLSLAIDYSLKDYRDEYNNIYRVIPLEKDAMFGISPEPNYKSSFYNMKVDFRERPTGFFKNLSELLFHIDKPRYLKPPFQKKKIIKSNYIRIIKMLDEIIKSDNINYDHMKMEKEDVNKIKEFNSGEEFIDYYFNPEKNNFKLLNYKNIIEEISHNKNRDREIWTDSACILINIDKFREFYKIN